MVNILGAQPITCSNFSINSIYQDTLNPALNQVNITFNGGPNQLANYPHVSLLLDCNGDTIANGGLFWFGQLGQTAQDYPVNLTGSLACAPITAIFVFGDSLGNTLTCPLIFNTASTFESEKNNSKIICIPNPAHDQIQINVPINLVGEKCKIFDSFGRILYTDILTNNNTSIDIRGFKNGIYLLSVGEGRSQTLRFVNV